MVRLLKIDFIDFIVLLCFIGLIALLGIAALPSKKPIPVINETRLEICKKDCEQWQHSSNLLRCLSLCHEYEIELSRHEASLSK